MKLTIRQIGGSRGVLIPKPLLAQVGLEKEAELTVESGALVLRKPAKPVRAGWEEAARQVAGEAIALGAFANASHAGRAR